MFQVSPSMTPGNQKWKGAAPLFNNRAEEINKFLYLRRNWLFILSKINIRMTANKNTDEANAWVKKYFKEASEDIKLFVLIIKGINDNKLISNPIHAPNQDVDETVTRVPLIRVIKNNKLDEFLKIKKKRVKTFISGVWTQ